MCASGIIVLAQVGLVLLLFVEAGHRLIQVDVYDRRCCSHIRFSGFNRQLPTFLGRVALCAKELDAGELTVYSLACPISKV